MYLKSSNTEPEKHNANSLSFNWFHRLFFLILFYTFHCILEVSTSDYTTTPCNEFNAAQFRFVWCKAFWSWSISINL